jgi:type VI secretion system secreted protein Hcp
MAADYLLVIDGVKGESEDTQYPESLELMAWSWGETNMGSAGVGGGSGTEKVHMQDFSFSIQMGKGSPKMAQFCATGEHIPTAVLHCRKSGGGEGADISKEYLTFTFKDVFISSYQVGGSAGIPTESITFNFTELEQVYKPQSASGEVSDNVRFGFNVKTAKTT